MGQKQQQQPKAPPPTSAFVHFKLLDNKEVSTLGSELRELTLYRCPVTDWQKSLANLKKNKHLREVTIIYCELSVGINLRGITTLKGLRTLRIENCNVGACGAREIARLLQVRQLSLTNNRLQDDGAKYISRMECYLLCIGNNSITNDGIYSLSKMVSLKKLDLGYNSFDSLGFSHITFMFNLKVIAVERFQTYTNMIMKRMRWVRFNEFTTSLVMEVGEDDQQ